MKSREFVVSLAKNPPWTMAEMLLKAEKYINVEDALAAIKEIEKPNKKERMGDDRRGRKREQTDCQNVDGNKRKDDKTPQMVRFTPLVMSVDKILHRLKMSTTSSGQGHYTRHTMFVTRGNTAVSIKIMTIT